MKTITFIFSFIVMLNSFNELKATTPVYLTFITHNEENEIYNNFNYYIQRRNITVQLAIYVVQKGVKWDFQSDWKFLVAVKNFDTGNVVSNTNGKNLIKWLTEDMGISCDPHAHESQYNYADVAYLHSQLGITPTPIVGGFIYNQIIGGNNWEDFEDGKYGRIYTNYFWKPDILWGGGTPLHVNDPMNYGAWKPQSMTNFYTHDSTKHLTLLGNGCTNKIFDTTTVTSALDKIRNLMNALEYNLISDTGFYTATVFMSVGQFNTAQLNKMKQFIDTMSIYVSQGKVQWKTIGELYDLWNTTYQKKPFWIQCGDLPTGYSVIDISLIPEGFLNLTGNFLNSKDTVRTFLRSVTSPYSPIDSSFALIDSLAFKGSFIFQIAASGNYYIQLKHRNALETWSKAGGINFIQGTVMNYDFTSLQSQAYKNNLILKGTKYCLFSGDVYKDGVIDGNDLQNCENDAANFISGYYSSDLTGEGITDAEDLSIIDNNASNQIGVITP